MVAVVLVGSATSFLLSMTQTQPATAVPIPDPKTVDVHVSPNGATHRGG